MSRTATLAAGNFSVGEGGGSEGGGERRPGALDEQALGQLGKEMAYRGVPWR
ncbi:hypothetical protein [Streptomyces sp. NRRL S-337]|uniref:hypothetical protein n=1 Tax=Streptomyces sp. NRRL S-337 TaxID=1463900 RepID=UPI00131DB61D|nr:hypothetical protein [Streptomyces sp. NRRL S-337]